jgi:hypothetical protein
MAKSQTTKKNITTNKSITKNSNKIIIISTKRRNIITTNITRLKKHIKNNKIYK